MESTLALTLVDLQASVGAFMGYGRGSVLPYVDQTWTALQQADIDEITRSGLRQFYFAAAADGTSSPYDWSFLRTVATLDLPAGSQEVQLPDDFAGMEGEVTLLSTSGLIYMPIKQYNSGRIRSAYSVTPTRTGRPIMCALEPIKGTTALAGQRQSLLIFPIADTDYTLQFEYYVLSDYLSTPFPYPLGGMAHAETILESCLCVAEQRKDDASTVHAMKYQERLQASIGLDRRNKPQSLGYNGNWQRGGRRPWNHCEGQILYNGQQIG